MSLTSYRAAPSRDTFCGLPPIRLLEAVVLAYRFRYLRPGRVLLISFRENSVCGLLLGLAVTYSPGA